VTDCKSKPTLYYHRRSIGQSVLVSDTHVGLATKTVTVEVEVTLRLTVNQSVCLGVGYPFGAHDQISLFLSFAGKLLCSSFWGALFDERTGL
jgi:hypothetical protein